MFHSYIAITGLIIEQPFTVEVPAHRCRWLPNGETKDFGNTSVDFIPLTLDEMFCELNEYLDKEDFIVQFINAIRPNTDVPIHYAFIRIKTEKLDPNLDLISVFILDAIRFYLGSKIEIGPKLTFSSSGMDSDKFVTCETYQRLSQMQGYVLYQNITEGFQKFLYTFGGIYQNLIRTEDIKISFRYLNKTFGFLDGMPFEDKILFTTIALEALFSPPSGQELKYRVSQIASVFLGADEADREKIFLTISLAYDIRSAVAHGSFIDFGKYEPKFTNLGFSNLFEFCDQLNHCAREAILRRAKLYNEDSTCNKQAVIKLLEQFCRHTHNRIDAFKLEPITLPISACLRR